MSGNLDVVVAGVKSKLTAAFGGERGRVVAETIADSVVEIAAEFTKDVAPPILRPLVSPLVDQLERTAESAIDKALGGTGAPPPPPAIPGIDPAMLSKAIADALALVARGGVK